MGISASTTLRAYRNNSQMTYAVAHEPSAALTSLVAGMRASLETDGFPAADGTQPPQFVLNLIDPDRPRPFRRRSRGTYVAALHAVDREPDDPLRHGYPLLVRALANIS